MKAVPDPGLQYLTLLNVDLVSKYLGGKQQASFKFILNFNLLICYCCVEIVAELGGQMTDDVRDCTVLVADQIKRTAKVFIITSVPYLVKGTLSLNQ
jgi:hypothetical protein